MKKRILKSWVEKSMIIINIFAIIIIASETTNTTLFVISKIIAFVILLTNSKLIIKYGKEEF
ncbi:MAG: hypothetical protein IJ690_02050 [Clostridia bacterium]|nr:hypothetical protein [Clostridia bacterium]MBR1653724.1 hypothetical protein [Clostridia bacterium]